MIMYPVWEVDLGLVALGDGELSLPLGLIGGSGHGNVSRNSDTSPPEVICNATDMEINVIHLTKLLCCLLVVAP